MVTEVNCPECGSSFSLIATETTATFRPGVRKLAHFDLLEEVSVGRFGTVFKARDTVLDRVVAVKVPRATQLQPADEEYFFRDARAAAQLRHPGIVSVHEVGRDGDTIFIASDFVEGADLKQWLSARRLTDQSGALASRMIVLPLEKSFFGREDHGLTDRLLAGLPGILMWAVAGWSRLREQGRLTVPACSRDMAEEMEELSSPMRAFVAECCVVGPEFRVAKGDLYSHWRQWCEAHGRQPGTQELFSRDLRAAVPEVRSVRPRSGDDRVYSYAGIGIRGRETGFFEVFWSSAV